MRSSARNIFSRLVFRPRSLDQASVAVKSLSQWSNQSQSNEQTVFSARRLAAVAAGLGAVSFAASWSSPANAKSADAKALTNPAPTSPVKPAGQVLSHASSKDTSTLPTFSIEEVSKHRSVASGIWVTYHGDVYDITDFVQAHPGGVAKIMLAAGGSIEPFWAMYKQHNKEEVKAILVKHKIGHLAGGAAASAGKAIEDPFLNDPARHPALIQRSAKPCNAETPGSLLSAQIITPVDLFYVRNHLSVPEVDIKGWKLKIQGEGMRTLEFTLEELQTHFKKHVMTSTIQCAGNRRSEMKAIKPVKGLDWGIGAIGTATFGGVLLKDVLEYAGLKENEVGVNHIHFVGLDSDPLTSEVYAASIPVHKAYGANTDLLLAWEMNDQPLTRDHGYPLRLIAPGIIGARNVKWLSTIVASGEENGSFWQKKDYKPFSPSVDWDNVDWDSASAIQEAPITSAICEPEAGTEVYLSDGDITARGYAWSGGGRDVIRVDLSVDGGKSWQTAKLNKLPQRPGHVWAWCLWESTLVLPEGTKVGDKLDLICRAVDDNCCAQPDGVDGIWNMRGVLNNAWHRLSYTVV